MLRRLLLVVVLVLLCVAVPTGGADNPDITVDVNLYDGNPVLVHGEEGEWDAGIWAPNVIYHEGVFHMLYQGYSGSQLTLGYATSEDGLNWAPYEGNPVYVPDGEIGQFVGNVWMMIEGDTWVIYVCSVPYLGTYCDALYRVTAPDLTGPWSVDPEPILEAGGVTDWDSPQIAPYSFVKTDEEYVLYYATNNYTAFGMATSPDGIVWTKYDDPATTERKYANSDPVMMPGEAGTWDSQGIGSPCVRQRDGAWEMFYGGGKAGSSPQVGYATSTDGISWTRYPDNPVAPIDGLDAVIRVDDVYYIYFTVMNEWNIAVATGTVTWE